MKGLKNISIGHLSTGQRQRLRLLALESAGFRLWLLDEPLSGLDKNARVQLDHAIKRHTSSGGAALVSTHQPLGLKHDFAITLGDVGVGGTMI